jgi:general secretion pathway protein A
MPLILRVTSYRNQPPAEPLNKCFGEQGGTLGRSPSNDFMLPDPNRYVSRHHATIRYREGAYYISDTSSVNPIKLNGQFLAYGQEVRLAHGDLLVLGEFHLQADVIQEQEIAEPEPVAKTAVDNNRLGFFKLREPPFQLVPDPKFLFFTKRHAQIKASLKSCLLAHTGLTVITGEPGTGKTILIRELLSGLGKEVALARLFQTQLNDVELLQAVLVEFGFKPFNARKVELLDMLNTFLINSFSQAQQPLLIIDEAQDLKRSALEEVRLLSGLETEKEKVLQIILIGQPQLDKTIDSPGMEAFKQRIQFRCRLAPLMINETSAYITYRLTLAGAEDAALFAPETIPAIYKYTGGIPRLINVLCDTALTCAFSVEAHVISSEVLEEAITELNWFPYGQARVTSVSSKATKTDGIHKERNLPGAVR